MPDLNKIIEDLSSLTVAEAAELSKQLEEKWGVTPMAAAAPAAAGGAAPAEEKDDFTIMLVSAGDKKINVIKEVRGVGLLIGLQLNVELNKFINSLTYNKLLTIRAAENVVRILPPLNVKKKEIDLALKIINRVCKEYK